LLVVVAIFRRAKYGVREDDFRGLAADEKFDGHLRLGTVGMKRRSAD